MAQARNYPTISITLPPAHLAVLRRLAEQDHRGKISRAVVALIDENSVTKSMLSGLVEGRPGRLT